MRRACLRRSTPLLALRPTSIPRSISSSRTPSRGSSGGCACATGCRRSFRAPLRLANAWHSVGPVLVLAAAGAPTPALRNTPILIGALAAQFAVDYVSTATLERLRVGLSPRTLARFIVWAYAVDITLAAVALAVARSAQDSPAAVLLTLPLIGLLAFFARERKSRIDHALELSHAYRGTALLLGDVVEADDAYTGTHSRD